MNSANGRGVGATQDVRSRPLWTAHCVLRRIDFQQRRIPSIVAGGVQSWGAQALEDGGGERDSCAWLFRDAFDARGRRDGQWSDDHENQP